MSRLHIDYVILFLYQLKKLIKTNNQSSLQSSSSVLSLFDCTINRLHTHNRS